LPFSSIEIASPSALANSQRPFSNWIACEPRISMLSTKMRAPSQRA
jgi:hypothetical protein